MRKYHTGLMFGLMLAFCVAPTLAQTTYRITDLGTLGGTRTEAAAINASGQVTGASELADETNHAFLWDGTTMKDLGTLGGVQSRGNAINASGQVSGYAYYTTGNAFHAFLWDGTTMRDLGTLGGTSSDGRAINDSGQVTGEAYVTNDAGRHAFLWDGTTMKDLGTLGGTISDGISINASGQVTGVAYTTGDAAWHAFLWDGTTMQDLGTFGGRSSAGIAINASGQVTGYAYVTGDSAHAFLWDGAAMQDLGTLGGANSYAYDMNASGQVTGESYTTIEDEWHALLWDGTTMQDLGTLGGTPSVGRAINASGQVTGQSHRPGDAHYHAVLWDDATIHDLNDLIDPSDPLKPYVTLLDGIDINDCGQIVASGIDSRSTGGTRAFLVSPVTVCDTTPPSVVITSPANGATYFRNATVLASYTCDDGLSGIATCQGDVANGAAVPTSVLGPQSFTVTGTDVTGNVTVTSVGYTIQDASTSLTLTPYGAVSFGNVAVGGSNARPFTLRNTGAGPLPISSIVTTGPQQAMFTIAHDCGASLAAGASCTIVVTFRPNSVGSKTATLRLTTGNGLVRNRPLTGTGVSATPNFTLAPGSLSFGNQRRQTRSAPQTVTLRNTGAVALGIKSIANQGSQPQQFLLTHNCGASVAVGASCKINVVFRPNSPGAKSATLKVIAAGGSLVRTVSLAGTGTN